MSDDTCQRSERGAQKSEGGWGMTNDQCQMTNQMPSSNDQTRRRASYDIRVHVGRWARVHTCFGGYELPAGLPENAEVRLEAFDRGYWTVRFEGGSVRGGNGVRWAGGNIVG